MVDYWKFVCQRQMGHTLVIKFPSILLVRKLSMSLRSRWSPNTIPNHFESSFFIPPISTRILPTMHDYFMTTPVSHTFSPHNFQTGGNTKGMKDREQVFSNSFSPLMVRDVSFAYRLIIYCTMLEGRLYHSKSYLALPL